MTYRVSVYKYLEVPKTLLHETIEGSEEEAATHPRKRFSPRTEMWSSSLS